MSFYNALFGENKNASELLESLSLERSEIARYRDCFLNQGKIIIYTRTGGKNWRNYKKSNQKLMDHPSFLKVEKVDPDNTYATFYFDTDQLFPTEFEDKMPQEKWNDFHKRHENGGPYSFLENEFNRKMKELMIFIDKIISDATLKGIIAPPISLLFIDKEDIQNPGYNVSINGLEFGMNF